MQCDIDYVGLVVLLVGVLSTSGSLFCLHKFSESLNYVNHYSLNACQDLTGSVDVYVFASLDPSSYLALPYLL